MKRNWPAWFLFVAFTGMAITLWAFLYEPAAKIYVLEKGGARLVPEPGETPVLDKLAEWAHHFGPELVVLAFAAYFIEYKRDEEAEAARDKENWTIIRESERQARLDSLEAILHHVEHNNAFFAGDIGMTLKRLGERLSLQDERKADDIFRTDEAGLYFHAMTRAKEVLALAQSSAVDAGQWESVGAELRSQLHDALAAPPGAASLRFTSAEFDHFEALDQIARLYLRQGFAAFDPKSSVFDSTTQPLLAKLAGLSSVRAIGGRSFDVYMSQLSTLFKIKKRLLEEAAGLRDALEPLRSLLATRRPHLALSRLLS